MPAPRSVTDEQIQSALQKSGGNLREASVLLGKRPNYLHSLQYSAGKRRAQPPPRDLPIDIPEYIEPLTTGKRIKHYSDILKFAHDSAATRREMNPRSDLGSATIKAKGPIGVFLISDLHLGSPQCDYRTFIKHVDLLHQIPNLYAIIQGDVLEYAISPRMLDAVLSQDLSPQEQAQLWKQIIDDLSDKLLAAVIGNHELRAESMGAFDVGLYMYETFIAKKKAYLKDGGTLRIHLGSVEYSWRVTHGDSRFGSMYTKTHKASQLARMSFGWHDISSTGHTHEAAIYTEDQPISDGAGTRTVVSLQAGSYKVIGGERFPDRLGFMRSNKVRMPGVILWPDEKRIMPFYTVEDMVTVLKALNGNSKEKRAGLPRTA